MTNEPEVSAGGKTYRQDSKLTEVEYVLLPEDVITFTKYTWRCSSKTYRKARRRLWLAVYLCAAMTALYIGGVVLAERDRHKHIDNERISHPGWLLIGVAGLTAPGAFVVALYYALLQRYIALARLINNLQHGECRRFLGWRRMSLSPESIMHTDADGSYSLKWKAIEGIDVTEEYAYFFVLENQAYILPKRPFVTHAEFRFFVDTAREFHQKAMISSLATPTPEAMRPADSNVKSLKPRSV